MVGFLAEQGGSDGQYNCEVNLRKGLANQVIAQGVRLNGSNFIFVGLGHGRLPLETVFTAISNTSAQPINGTFANLPDGEVVLLEGNNLQADYEGGDGNDLTLTVVP